MPDGGLQQLLARATAPELLTQLLMIAAVVIAALAVGHYARAWYRRGGFAAQAGWQPRVVEGCVALAAPFVALVMLLVTRALLHGSKSTLVDTALQLGTVLLLVRLLVYFATVLMGRDSWVRRWDTRLTLILWLLISFSVLGWFGFVENTLDAIDIIPGKGRFTISVLESKENPEGKYLPTIFTVNTWNAEGALVSSLTEHDSWVRLGKLDVPQRVVQTSAGKDKVVVRVIEFSNLEVPKARTASK